MAELECRDPIMKLVKSATSLQIPKETFDTSKEPTFLSTIEDNGKDRVVHFHECQQVEFYWESEIGSHVPVWARKGDFTATLPSGISAIIAWGEYILDEDVKKAVK